MKKITLLLATFVASFTMNGQQSCSQDQPTQDFASGASIIDGFQNGGQTVANDFILAGSTTLFTSDGMSASLLATNGDTFDSVEIAFFDDAAGVPGTQIGTTMTIVPTSQTEVFTGTLGDGTPFSIRDVVIDFPSTQAFIGNGTSDETIFWVSIVANPTTASTLVGWENVNSSDTSLFGASLAFMNQNTSGAWTSSQNQDGSLSDGVFEMMGMCTGGSLNIDDNNSLISEISVYPNPVNDVLNISVPATLEVESATLVDILGKATPVQISNGTVNTANLNSGIYLLNITTNEGTITKKIIKN